MYDLKHLGYALVSTLLCFQAKIPKHANNATISDGTSNRRLYLYPTWPLSVRVCMLSSFGPKYHSLSNRSAHISTFDAVIARYNEDKAKEVANIEVLEVVSVVTRERPTAYPRSALVEWNSCDDSDVDRERDDREGSDVEIEWDARRNTVNRQINMARARKAPLIHGKVFRTCPDQDSTHALVEWIWKAAALLDCPDGFYFPAVRAKIPTAWIDANLAMDGLKAGESGKRYVTWREAVETFAYFMDTKGTPLPDSHDILLRAMRHREAEGGVLLTLGDGAASVGGVAGMLYLDPTWLIELIRRLTDHNLVDPEKQDSLKNELEKYGEAHVPPLRLNTLWTQHRQEINRVAFDTCFPCRNTMCTV